MSLDPVVYIEWNNLPNTCIVMELASVDQYKNQQTTTGVFYEWQ